MDIIFKKYEHVLPNGLIIWREIKKDGQDHPALGNSVKCKMKVIIPCKTEEQHVLIPTEIQFQEKSLSFFEENLTSTWGVNSEKDNGRLREVTCVKQTFLEAATYLKEKFNEEIKKLEITIQKRMSAFKNADLDGDSITSLNYTFKISTKNPFFPKKFQEDWIKNGGNWRIIVDRDQIIVLIKMEFLKQFNINDEFGICNEELYHNWGYETNFITSNAISSCIETTLTVNPSDVQESLKYKNRVSKIENLNKITKTLKNAEKYLLEYSRTITVLG